MKTNCTTAKSFDEYWEAFRKNNDIPDDFALLIKPYMLNSWNTALICASKNTYFKLIEWALDTVDGFSLDDRAMELFEQAMDEYYENDKSKYPSPHYSDR